MDIIDASTAFLGGLDKDKGSMRDSTVPSETHTITGTATSDSADGLVMVDLEGYTISEDNQQSLELPTTVDVHEGDTVQVTLVGGVGKSPIVTGVVGGGDRLSTNVTEALDAAQAAELVVRALNYYFFHDEYGAHVTTEPNNPNAGPNALLDALALHFRDGLDVYAKFGRDGSQIGKDDEAHMVMDANSMELLDENDSQYFFAGDRRDLVSQEAEMTESFYVISSNTFLLSSLVDSVHYVKVNGTETTNYIVAPDSTFTSLSVLTINDHVVYNDQIEISYITKKRTLAFSLGGKAKGPNSVAESGSFAYGLGSHSEGVQSSSYGWYSHAEGQATETTGLGAHSEGVGSKAIDRAGHAEGVNTSAGYACHAEGQNTMALDSYTHAEGLGTKAGSMCQHVFGMYNVPEIYGHYVELVGNGSADNTRSNARTLDWFGNEELKGALYLGGCRANGETPYPAPRYNTLTSNLEYWDGTAWQTIPIASTGPKIYADSVVKTASGTNCQLWTKAAFESTFHTTNAQSCGVMISNGEAGSLSTVVSAEYWSSGSNPGWFAKWTNSVGSGKRRFNYIVVVPEDVQA